MLKDILAISGKTGLFKFISQGRNGVIVESLEDGKRMNAFTSVKVSSLEDVAIYTDKKEVPLEKIFKKINEKENGGECPSHKSTPDEMKNYFLQILPNYDQERVYMSDIKKILQWYNLLLKYNLLKFEEEDKKEEKEKSSKAKKENAIKTKKSKTDSKKKPETKKNIQTKKPVSKQQQTTKTTTRQAVKKGTTNK